MSDIEQYMEPIVDFIKDATPAQMEEEFKVPFGSGGPREYYFRPVSDHQAEGSGL